MAVANAFGSSREYEGIYKFDAPIESKSCDEIVISNVFGDYHVAASTRHMSAVLDEACRVVKPDGMIVIRETITPDESNLPLTELVKNNPGIDIFARVNPSSNVWNQLERIYGNIDSTAFPYTPQQYYLFITPNNTDTPYHLQKTTQ